MFTFQERKPVPGCPWRPNTAQQMLSCAQANSGCRPFRTGLNGTRLGPPYKNRPLEGRLFDEPCLETAFNLVGKNKPAGTEKVHDSSKSKVKDQRHLSGRIQPDKCPSGLCNLRMLWCHKRCQEAKAVL